MPIEFRKEKLIKEQRTIDANKRNLMGVSGKLGIIARYLGHPIISQSGEGGFGCESNSLDFDTFLYDDDEEIPVIEENTNSHEIGYVFDGLSIGNHIEIKYLEADHKLIVNYKSYRVYEEIAGDLTAYAPFKEWEEIIDKIYEKARKKQKEMSKDEEEINEQQNAQEALSFFQKLRLRWGI